ncbi:CLUMA_CG011124, isoform A [Clunio marinus]|uniref:CLUMA_CG011124, isoform A n=1 Tax=Clunio marinus TaxID=568069 RepID=A0A1J1IBY6_9DIPT|nr:CLUMA_CG011124, isoform A [Clunio marinus]
MYESDLLLLIFLILLFAYLKSSFQSFIKYHQLFRKIKGPKTLPLGLIAYIFTANSEADRFQILQNLSKKYPNFYSLWFGSKYLFVTDDPNIAQKLLTYPQCVEKNFFMELFGFPNGLISLKSDRWKSERKLLNSSFSLPVLQSYIPIFDKSIRLGVKELQQKCDKGEFDIKHDVTFVVMNAVLNTTFGREISKDVIESIIKSTEKLLDIVWSRSMNPLLYYDSIYSLTSMKKQEDSHRRLIFKFIDEEWNELQNGSKSILESSFIHQLIKVSNDGRMYTKEEVNDHVGTMLVAAGDTTSTALNFLFLMLAMHENIQHRIVKEINEVFGELEDLIVDYEKLSELKYVEMVIKETLRLFSPATGIFREVKAEVDLGKIDSEIENLRLPQGTNLIINVFGLHRKKEIWGENAEAFNPENFLAEKMSERHNYCFLPFANGSRLCIGNRYAMIFMKLIVAHYVKNFHFSTSLKYEDVKVKAGITLGLIGDFSVAVTKRR